MSIYGKQKANHILTTHIKILVPCDAYFSIFFTIVNIKFKSWSLPFIYWCPQKFIHRFVFIHWFPQNSQKCVGKFFPLLMVLSFFFLPSSTPLLISPSAPPPPFSHDDDYFNMLVYKITFLCDMWCINFVEETVIFNLYLYF